MVAKKNCPDCDKPLQMGRVQGYGDISNQPYWESTEKIVTPKLFGFVDEKPAISAHSVFAYRCADCGFLQWYAK